MNKKLLGLFAGLAAFGIGVPTAQAVPIFTQAPDYTSGRGSRINLSSSVSTFETADNFTLSSTGTVRSITWVGFYDNLNSDDFTIRFFNDDPGSPGNPATSAFATYNVGGSVNRTDTGIDTAFGSRNYSYSANISDTLLTGGTQYYVSIVNDISATPVATDDWFWGSNSADTKDWYRPPPGGGPGWFAASTALGSHAFSLNDARISVPEPTTLALFGLALAGLPFMRRKTG